MQAGRACFEGEQYDFVGFHPLSADALMQIKAVLKTDPAVKQVIYELPSSGGTDALPGDVDGDFTVTAADARLALRAAVALETLTPEQTAVADADFDGSITAADARLILRAAVGLETLKLY
ncbi:MAG: hypothetical protein IK104_05895 [Clostridia bacterium]|nr:hypothetical protein [Clostridia bacterium]